MTVKTPIIWTRVPLLDVWEVEAAVLLDDMSGASPQYLDSLSGASGLGVEDDRKAYDLKVTRHFDRYSLALGGSYSDEDDWTSRSGVLEGRWWTDDKNTTVLLGASPTFDDITSTNNIELSEDRTTLGWILGVTQVLSPISILQSNFVYQNGDGYHTDQYKFLDRRPRSRDEYIWLTRYNHYLESLGAALHNDYRFVTDSWGMSSHMVEVKWYQPVGEYVLVRPHVRYYTQSSAEFFSTEFPPTDFEKNVSFDQRLSAFGSFSLGIKAEVAISETISFDLLAQWIEQRGSWRAFGEGTEGLKDFKAQVIGAGISAKF
jgi:hypothetical protein